MDLNLDESSFYYINPRILSTAGSRLRLLGSQRLQRSDLRSFGGQLVT